MSQMNDYYDYSEQNLDVTALRMHVNTVLGAAISGMTIYLILTRSTSTMGQFKYFLLNIQVAALVSDLWLSLVYAPFPLFTITTFCTSSTFFRHLTDSYWGEKFHFAVMNVCISYMGVSVLTGALYRFLVLRQQLDFLHSRAFVLCVAIVVVLLPLPCVLVTSLAYRDAETSLAYVRDFSPKLALFVARFPCATIPDRNAINLYVIFACSAIILVALLGGIITWRTWSVLASRRSQMSARTYEMHKQLLLAILLQFTVPFSVVLVPLVSMHVLYLLRFTRLTELAITCFQLLALHASFNGVITVLTISPYRNAIAGWIGFRRARHVSPASPVTSTVCHFSSRKFATAQASF